MVLAFPLVGNWLVWKVGRGTKVKVGEDPWIGCGEDFRLTVRVIQFLTNSGYYRLNQIADTYMSIIWNQKWVHRIQSVRSYKALSVLEMKPISWISPNLLQRHKLQQIPARKHLS